MHLDAGLMRLDDRKIEEEGTSFGRTKVASLVLA